MFSPCVWGFSQGTPASSHSPGIQIGVRVNGDYNAPFPLVKNPLTPTNIWLLSAMGIGIHSQSYDSAVDTSFNWLRLQSAVTPGRCCTNIHEGLCNYFVSHVCITQHWQDNEVRGLLCFWGACDVESDAPMEKKWKANFTSNGNGVNPLF